jgi:lysozyme family protein
MGTPDPFLDIAMGFNWRPENDGQGPHCEANDPGGWTSWGMTLAVWQAWQRIHGDTDDPEVFKAAERDTFLPIYRANYWQATRCDELHPAVALMTFDAAVGSGPARAIRFIQLAVGVFSDGIFGNLQTMPAVKRTDPIVLVHRIGLARMDYYSGQWAHGWRRRTADCLVLANTLFPAQESTH